jgi:uncharacterized protein YuzE
MIIKYDEVTDSIYFIVSDEKPYESQEIENGVIVDYGKNDDIVAIEVLKFKSEHKDLDIPIVGNFLLKQAS